VRKCRSRELLELHLFSGLGAWYGKPMRSNAGLDSAIYPASSARRP
jgi:hypothetical protein